MAGTRRCRAARRVRGGRPRADGLRSGDASMARRPNPAVGRQSRRPHPVPPPRSRHRLRSSRTATDGLLDRESRLGLDEQSRLSSEIGVGARSCLRARRPQSRARRLLRPSGKCFLSASCRLCRARHERHTFWSHLAMRGASGEADSRARRAQGSRHDAAVYALESCGDRGRDSPPR